MIIASTTSGDGRIRLTSGTNLQLTNPANTWSAELLRQNGSFQLSDNFTELTATFTGEGGNFALNGRTLLFGSGTLDGNALAPAVYTAADLNALGVGGPSFAGSGTLEVIPEPSAAILSIVVTLALVLGRRRW